MARYVLTDLAKQDVREIISYIRKRSPQSAKKVQAELRDAMRLLAEFPLIGHYRDDIAPEPLRFWSVYSYLIAYRPDAKPLQVIRVVHGARDLDRLFRGEQRR